MKKKYSIKFLIYFIRLTMGTSCSGVWKTEPKKTKVQQVAAHIVLLGMMNMASDTMYYKN
jgi:hypothetical protein